jgi:hypothetical protein
MNSVTANLEKPLGGKAYGSIPHLPGSRRGPGDHGVNIGQYRMCCEKSVNGSRVICQYKLDGSCCAVARVNGELVALGRAGYLARTSRFEQHQMFADWVDVSDVQFEWLQEGERVVGEWLAQAHGTRYDLEGTRRDAFVVFDLMRGHRRATVDEFTARLDAANSPLSRPPVIDSLPFVSMARVHAALQIPQYGELDPCEGAVWRVERGDEVLFLAKYVRPDKQDGKYLPEISGHDPVWNYRPEWDFPWLTKRGNNE